jgi:hypothetical protein
MKIFYSIKRKGDGLINLSGSFVFVGKPDKAKVKPLLAKSIEKKWNIPFSEIERVDCYYFEGSQAVEIDK